MARETIRWRRLFDTLLESECGRFRIVKDHYWDGTPWYDAWHRVKDGEIGKARWERIGWGSAPEPLKRLCAEFVTSKTTSSAP